MSERGGFKKPLFLETKVIAITKGGVSYEIGAWENQD